MIEVLAAYPPPTPPRPPRLFFGLPVDEAFVDLDDTARLVHVLFKESSAEAARHVPSSFERTEAHIAPELPGADALLAGQHEVASLNQSRKGLLVFSKTVPAMIENLQSPGGRRSFDLLNQHARLPQQGVHLPAFRNGFAGMASMLECVFVAARSARPRRSAMHTATRLASDRRRSAGFA